MLVQRIKEVPDDFFDPALMEVSRIDWSTIIDPRKQSTEFATSTAVHLRIHKIDFDNMPKSVSEFSRIVDCMDAPKNANYVECYKLANWVMSSVNGIRLGRVMIIRLEAGGTVGLHIDPHEYFEVYSRYHVPLVTNENVLFSGNDGIYEHMPYKMLCRLNNRLPHMLENKGSDYRIHLLVDVETAGGNIIF